MTSLRDRVGSTLAVQVAWALLAAVWNVAGVALLWSGQRPPGPTASLAGGVVLLLIAALLLIFVSRWPVAFTVLSAVCGLIALGAVVNAFRADPSLWPSEFWRYAGAALNGAGFLASVLAVVAYFRWRA